MKDEGRRGEAGRRDAGTRRQLLSVFVAVSMSPCLSSPRLRVAHSLDSASELDLQPELYRPRAACPDHRVRSCNVRCRSNKPKRVRDSEIVVELNCRIGKVRMIQNVEELSS